MTGSDPHLDLLEQQLAERAGLRFTGARRRWLRDFLVGHDLPPRENGGDTGLLDDDAFGRLCDAVTVQESYFFREPARLELVRREVLPSLPPDGPLRVWSAGCARGEEAYTLSMTLTDAGLGGRFDIVGTDLSSVAVQAARTARYGAWSLRGLERAEIDRLFTPAEAGHEVARRFRDPVRFERHNLLTAAPAGGPFDLVLCRNVLIYFTAAATRRALEVLAGSLRPGGWLVTGVSDPVAEGVPGLHPVSTAYGLAYRRLDDPPRREPPAAPPRPRSVAVPRPPAPATTVRSAGSEAPAVPAGTALLEAAERALLEARSEDAEDLARAALADPTARAQAHHALIRAIADRGRLDDAVVAAEQALAEFPGLAPLRGLHALVLLESGRTEDARAAARAAIYLAPDAPLPYAVLERASAQLGDAVTALRARRNGHRILARSEPR